MTLSPGTVVAERFTLRSHAGRGGMGSVYQAHDSESGRMVALKLLHATAGFESARRFTREAQVLSRLRHPGLVSYVTHGLTTDGQPFLVMEWLEGEDLARRLVCQPLSLSETLSLLVCVADALASAHAQGIVHRDIKPSNLFLRGGRAEDVVLLDFGLAHVAAASQAITGSSMILGTPGYMAPEQASGEQEIAPAIDIFSLGCVLYECLTGLAPFRAPHLAAVLAKILYAEPTPLKVVRPELPSSLQSLVNRMLAKDPRQRLTDSQQLLGVLRVMGTPRDLPPPAPKVAPEPMPIEARDTEHQLVSVLLATSETPPKEESTPTLKAPENSRDSEGRESLLQELRSHGARATLLANNSLVATFLLERGTATDQAALGARCALLVKERWPESMVALTTGLSLRGKPLPVGEAMDKAGESLRYMEHQRLTPTNQVILDETTAGLLEPRFQLDKAVSGTFLLRGERLDVDESRPLLGRPTPCVGREQELTLLEMAFGSCVEESEARVILVTALAGTGKSRLRHEFLRRLERRGRPPLVLLGRGDPMSTGAAYGLLSQALRRLCGVVDGEPPEAQRGKLFRRAGQHLRPDLAKEILEFLGELCGVPVSLEDSPKLRAAREDPRLMNQQITQAMVSFLRVELSHGPVLLVLEDLHWSDAPTVRLVGEVLNELNESRLMVLELARPEAKELFPGLWARWVQEVPLRGLSQKASARLVQEVLGSQISPSVVARMVEQAAGNALFLEELIRGVAEGRGDELPGTVLAMLQSRLQRLEPRARRWDVA